MPVSMDSSRPMLADSTSENRYSTFSMAPSVAPSVTSTESTIPSDIAAVATGLQRMENKALTSQRVVLSEERANNMQTLALGAKLERALDRRMSGQDAVMRPRAKTLPSAMVEKTAV